MTTKVSSPLLVCLSLLLLSSVKGDRFLSLEEIQQNAVFLSRYNSHSFQWELFPYISISCDCSITSWTFIATEQPSISNGQSIQFQLWTPIDNNNDSSFSLVRSVEVKIEQVERLSSLNSFGMSLLKLTMDPPVEVTGNTIFGLFQPYFAESDLVLQHQLRRAPDHYQHPNTPPSNVFVTNEANINNDYPLVAIEHSCSDRCVSGFLGAESVERFFADNCNVPLANHHGYNRLLPALNFTCNTTVTRVSLGARRVFGRGTPEIQIWRPQDKHPGTFSPIHNIQLAEIPAVEDPGVYEFIITDPLPVEEGDIVSVYETADSPLEVYNEKNANIFPPSIPIDDGNISILQPDGDWPLLSIETGDDGCTPGFMTLSDLVKKSLTLSFFTDTFNLACVVPDVQFPRDGLLSKLIFVGQFLQFSPSDSKLYPELQIWKVQENNDTYVRVTATGTSSPPHFTDHLNVYEFSFDPPVEVKEGYVLGYYQPPHSESRLELMSMQDKGPENYCVFGQNPGTLSMQSTAVKVLTHTPLVSFEYVANMDDECSGLCVENANCLGTERNYTCVCASGYTGDGFSSCVSNEESKKTLFIGVGVAIAGLALIATAAIIIIVLTCLRKRKKVITTDNVAYLSKNEEYTIRTSTNEAYDIATTTNEDNDKANVASDVSTSPNQTAEYSRSNNSVTYDYAYDYIPHTT